MYDLLVLSFNQGKPKKIDINDIVIKPLNQNGGKNKKYYHQIWPFINSAYGILYKLFTKDDFGEFECCDGLFDFGDVQENAKETLLPTIFAGTDHNDYISIRLSKEKRTLFSLALNEILLLSPISTIAFLCRGQSLDKEIILGTISADDFYSMLLAGEIKTNICYIVKGKTE